jgi:hypothetical protein
MQPAKILVREVQGHGCFVILPTAAQPFKLDHGAAAVIHFDPWHLHPPSSATAYSMAGPRRFRSIIDFIRLELKTTPTVLGVRKW